MKIKYILSLLICYTATNIFAQSKCSRFYPLEEGTSFQYTLYNNKDKVEGTTEYKVTDVNNENGNTNATMKIKFVDSKGKNVIESDYKISCTDDGIKMDYQSLFPTQMKQQYEEMGMEMEITGTDIKIPNSLTVGQTLDDSNINVNMSMTGMKMKINIDNYDRKVESKETVTTTAGTFDCYLLTEKTKSKVMMANQEMSGKIWLAEDVGMVKQETYNKKGKLISRMVLTEFSK
jgi:hypothetical protein